MHQIEREAFKLMESGPRQRATRDIVFRILEAVSKGQELSISLKRASFNLLVDNKIREDTPAKVEAEEKLQPRMLWGQSCAS